MLIDVETTELNRQRARDEVEDVVCVTGEVIVRQGAIVTPAQYAMLDALGKVDNDPTNMILGSALLMLGLVAAAGLYMYRYERDIARHPRTLLLLAILYVLVVGLALFFRIFNPYFVPTATGLGLLLITLLVRPRLAVFSTMLLAVPVSLIAGSNDNGLFNAITFSVPVSYTHLKIDASPIEAVFSTDTVDNPNIIGHPKFKTISVAPMFAETIMRFYNYESISSMFAQLPESIVRAGFELADLTL